MRPRAGPCGLGRQRRGNRPSLLKAMAVTVSPWPVRTACALAGGGIPHSDGLVKARGHEAPAVGIKADGEHAVRMAGQSAQRLRRAGRREGTRWIHRLNPGTIFPNAAATRSPFGLNASESTPWPGSCTVPLQFSCSQVPELQLARASPRPTGSHLGLMPAKVCRRPDRSIRALFRPPLAGVAAARAFE